MKSTNVKTSAPATKPVGKVAGSMIELVEIEPGQYQEPLIIALFGNQASGKSRLIGTAPGPIGLVPLERKSRQSVLDAAQEFGRKVISPSIDLIRTERAMLLDTIPFACVTEDSPEFKAYGAEDKVKKAEYAMQAKAKEMRLDSEMPMCCQRCYYRWHANREKAVALQMAERPDIQTIAIDTFGQFIDDMYFANYGRNDRIAPLDRKSFNREVVDFINAINHKNLILTHHSAEVYKDNKPTGKTKPKSTFSKLGHYVSVEIEMLRDYDAIKFNQKKLETQEARTVYTMVMKDCQANPSIIGLELTDDMISFETLALQVYPDAPDGFFS